MKSIKEVFILNERIKKVRKSLDLTQREFAERIGMKQNSIALIESGRNTSDQTIFAICREFNVNEEWLRTGIGEMFIPDASDEIEQVVNKYHLSNEMQVFIEKLVHTPPEVQDALINLIAETAAGIKSMEECGANPSAPAFSTSSEMSIDEKVEDYRRQLELEEKAKGKSKALQEDA